MYQRPLEKCEVKGRENYAVKVVGGPSCADMAFVDLRTGQKLEFGISRMAIVPNAIGEWACTLHTTAIADLIVDVACVRVRRGVDRFWLSTEQRPIGEPDADPILIDAIRLRGGPSAHDIWISPASSSPDGPAWMWPITAVDVLGIPGEPIRVSITLGVSGTFTTEQTDESGGLTIREEQFDPISLVPGSNR